MLVQLIYGSTASYFMDEADLVQILEKSRRNNAQKNITGLLLYKDRSFIQVLEGEAKDVDALYNIIKRDPRHLGVMIILRTTISQRMFPDWQMGFKNLNNINPEAVPGYSDYLNVPLNSETFRKQPSYAHTFLKIFRQEI